MMEIEQKSSVYRGSINNELPKQLNVNEDSKSIIDHRAHKQEEYFAPNQNNENLQPASERVVVVPPVVAQFGPNPIEGLTCSNCGTTFITYTITQYKCVVFAWCCAIIFCGGLLCAWIPFVMPGMKKTIHRCRVCNNVLGEYENLIPSSTNSSLCYVAVGTGIVISLTTLVVHLSVS